MHMFPGKKFEVAFEDFKIEESWNKTLSLWKDSGDAEKKECLQRLHILRDYFLNTIVDIKDEEDKESCFILMYIFSRVQWILLNTRVSYTANTSQSDKSLFYEAGMLSTLIGAMEERISAEKVDFITHILLRSVDDINPDGDWNPESPAKTSLNGLYEQIRHLEGELAGREKQIAQFEAEWSLLEAGVGKRSARGIIETVRELKDLLIHTTKSTSTPLAERYQDFDRAFGGLSAHHIVSQLERLKEQNSALEKDAQRWQSGQELLLKELGETDAERLVKRFREMQDTIARLSLGAQTPSVQSLKPVAETDNIDDLLLGIHNALSGINA